jgi:hypothetical protein
MVLKIKSDKAKVSQWKIKGGIIYFSISEGNTP